MPWNARLDPSTRDHVLDAQGRWEHDDGLGTKVYLALATERGSVPHDPEAGSRLYLLRRAKLLLDIDRTAEGYAQEALRPLVESGELTELRVSADRTAETGWLALSIEGVDRSGQRRQFEHRVKVSS